MAWPWPYEALVRSADNKSRADNRVATCCLNYKSDVISISVALGRQGGIFRVNRGQPARVSGPFLVREGTLIKGLPVLAESLVVVTDLAGAKAAEIEGANVFVTSTAGRKFSF
jgi:hypothetical protein